MSDKIRIMFICHGNICRSPMAEFIFKKLVEEHGIAEKFEICSSATSTEEIWNGRGNPVYPPARDELTKHGISCKGKRAIQLTHADYENYDMLIAMDSFNIRNIKTITGEDKEHKLWKLLDFESLASTSDQTVGQPIQLSGRDIPDPWYTGEFGLTYDSINKGCHGLLKYVSDIIKS